MCTPGGNWFRVVCWRWTLNFWWCWPCPGSRCRSTWRPVRRSRCCSLQGAPERGGQSPSRRRVTGVSSCNLSQRIGSLTVLQGVRDKLNAWCNEGPPPSIVKKPLNGLEIGEVSEYVRLFFCALCHDLLASEMPENWTFSLSYELISWVLSFILFSLI